MYTGIVCPKDWILQKNKLTNFETVLIKNGNHVGSSVLLLLAWIAVSDGRVDSKELGRLREIARASNHLQDVDEIIEIAKQQDIDALGIASEIVSMNIDSDRSDLFMQMAIGMAIADGYLITTENFIIRYIADLLGLSRARFQKIFMEVTGKEIPEPSDPSSAEYWQSRSYQNSQESQSQSAQSHHSTNHSAKYFAILGLEPGASKEEIKKAYRRLAQIHHPDRFHSLGQESVAAATSTFQRIKDAYDYLVKYA